MHILNIIWYYTSFACTECSVYGHNALDTCYFTLAWVAAFLIFKSILKEGNFFKCSHQFNTTNLQMQVTIPIHKDLTCVYFELKCGCSQERCKFKHKSEDLNPGNNLMAITFPTTSLYLEY